MLFRCNLLAAASFFPFSLLLCSALFAPTLISFFWCYKYRSRNNHSQHKNICAYCYTDFSAFYYKITFPSCNFFHSSFLFRNLRSSHLRIYSVYFGREKGRRVLLTWLSQLFLYLSFYFSSHFSFNSSSLTIPISPSIL